VARFLKSGRGKIERSGGAGSRRASPGLKVQDREGFAREPDLSNEVTAAPTGDIPRPIQEDRLTDIFGKGRSP